MTDKEKKIDQLIRKLDILHKKQAHFADEIEALRMEINLLQIGTTTHLNKENTNTAIKDPKEAQLVDELDELDAYLIEKEMDLGYNTPRKKLFNFEELDIEKFVGENLINKIGIVITVIGAGIGAKYSIEHQLISPLTRVILGYLLGLALLGFGIKLKKNYEKYSAVLVSGAMAIMYLITFTAYSMYELFPQSIAFALMVFFTIFTVIAALNYDKQVIAVVGLVGAYAVPFLLSDGSGNVGVMFSYMSIINIGILVIAFKKYWNVLYYSAFVLTWLIFLSWFGTKYNDQQFFTLAFVFATIFFLLFYVAFLAYKLLKKEKYQQSDVALLLSNSFIYFGIGYSILHQNENYASLVGLFTLTNAIVHFGVSTVIYRSKLADKNLLYLLIGLVLTFITIAIPIQLSGKWITLLWIGEATVLYRVGTTKNISFYKKMAYPLLVLASISMFIDWDEAYGRYISKQSESITPIFNSDFLMSLIFVGGLGIINYFRLKFASEKTNLSKSKSFLQYLIPLLFFFSFYMAFRLEIVRYWNQLFAHSEVKITGNGFGKVLRNYDLKSFKYIWIINYSLLFIGAWIIFNIKKLKNSEFGVLLLILLGFGIVSFLTQGLFELSELRDAYLHQKEDSPFVKGNAYIIIRYISFVFLAFATYLFYQYPKQAFMQNKLQGKKLKKAIEISIYTIVLWVLSSELLQWMAFGNVEQNYKLSLSIFWGIFALIMVGIGIKYNKKHLRIAAISLFAFTLLKLFFYDIASLNTLSKTIIFVVLGILLLLISFLYNKFKDLIINDDEKNIRNN
jgi:hypothetical protein